MLNVIESEYPITPEGIGYLFMPLSVLGENTLRLIQATLLFRMQMKQEIPQYYIIIQYKPYKAQNILRKIIMIIESAM